VHSAPDCETNATFPSAGCPAANVAFIPMRGTMIPRQLGPMILIPSNSAAAAFTSPSSAFPSAPVSRNPAERMMSPRIPCAPQSRTRPGTVVAGVQITARSGVRGREATSG